LYFSVSPTPARPVVFLGDSITYGGDWPGLFPNSSAVNRGIGGDSTLGLLKRLDQVIALKPSQIFLMIGTNDLCYNRPIPRIVANYRGILERFRDELPGTTVYVESVLPFNETMFPENGLRNNDEIRDLNKEIKLLAKQYRYPFIDLTSAFVDEDGRLNKEYTTDGLHLNKAGYLQWRQQIQQYVFSTKKI
jgi:lysophospholipase L1-like esterase